MLRVLDLFSGIGGFSLGLERAGMKTVAFCEIDPYCQRVLKKHWPGVPVYGDIRTLTAARLAADGIIETVGDTAGSRFHASAQTGIYRGEKGARARHEKPQRRGIDALCGGFPCQDISVAGKGAGIGGERSGLWSEYRRLVGELRPRIVIVENVTALLGRGLDVVLGHLAALRYDAEWHCIPASAVGAPHRRDRIWIVAYPIGSDLRDKSGRWNGPSRANTTKPEHDGEQEFMADANRIGRAPWTGNTDKGARGRDANGSSISADVGHPIGPGLEGRLGPGDLELQGATQPIRPAWASGFSGWAGDQWLTEPDVGRVAHGVPARVDRLRALGNAIVPQIAEIIGRAIVLAEAQT